MSKEIPLPNGKVAIVDDEDYDALAQYKWQYHIKGYAIRFTPRVAGKRSGIFMHRQLMNAPAGLQVDHEDGDGLNNQRLNLRLATSEQNNRNKRIRPGRNFKGTYLRKDQFRNKPWQAGLEINNKHITLGSYATEEEAARAYDKAARLYFGEFARTNFAA